MSEVGFFDEAAALKWQIMRMEGVMTASLNNTGSAIMELAARLQELAERQEAAAAAGVSASGLATVVVYNVLVLQSSVLYVFWGVFQASWAEGKGGG